MIHATASGRLKYCASNGATSTLLFMSTMHCVDTYGCAPCAANSSLLRKANHVTKGREIKEFCYAGKIGAKFVLTLAMWGADLECFDSISAFDTICMRAHELAM